MQAYGEIRPPGLCRHVSPPKREDDREGHYVFNLGENLTPRCKILIECYGLLFGYFILIVELEKI